MKTVLATSRPRNPYAEPARRRHAGGHRPSTKAERLQARKALRRELDGTAGADRHGP